MAGFGSFVVSVVRVVILGGMILEISQTTHLEMSKKFLRMIILSKKKSPIPFPFLYKNNHFQFFSSFY